MANGFNFTALNKYVDELSSPLMRKVLLEGTTSKWIQVIPGIKHSQALNVFEQTLNVQNDNTCGAGFVGSGTTTLSQQVLTVCPLKFNQSFCVYQAGGLQDYWTGMLMKAGSYHDTIAPFESVITDYITDLWQQELDKTLWVGGYAPTGAHSGDTAGNSGYYSSCQGFLYQVYNTAASGSVTTVSYSGTPTAANILNIVDAIVVNIDTNILQQDDLIMWVSPATIQTYKLALRNSNNYHIYVSDAKSVIAGGDGSAKENSLTQTVPGFNITMVATVGLKGYNGIFTTWAGNMVMGTDLMNDYESIFSYYSQDYDELRMVGRMRIGSQIKFPSQVVLY